MISLGLFALIFIPMILIIGIAASTISFTSWSLVVPLLFGGFGFSLYDTLFFAIVIDLLNGMILSFRYGKIKQVDYKLAMIASIPMLIGALGGFFFLREKFLANTETLKGGIGYLVLLVSLIFIWKGWKETQSAPMTEYPHETAPDLLQSPERDTLATKLPKKLSIFLLIIGIVISGSLGGLVGAGSGMNYALLFMIFLGFDIMQATGTSSLLMAIVMLVALFLFLPLANLPLIWPYLLIAISFTFIGTNLGLKYALQMSRAKLNYLVGGALFATGVIAIFEAIFI